MFHNPGWDPTWKRQDPTWDTPGIPGGNGGIPPHIFTWVSPVIKRAKNSTAFTSFFYKKVESKRFPWQEFKRQMLVFVGFHPILWCMTLEARENASDQSGIGFCSAFDWLKWRGEFSGPIKEQSKTTLVQFRITFDYQLKSALFHVLKFSAVHVILKKSKEKFELKITKSWNFSSLWRIGHLAIIFESLRNIAKFLIFLKMCCIELFLKVNRAFYYFQGWTKFLHCGFKEHKQTGRLRGT